MGVVPVATTEWFGEQPGALWPWAQESSTSPAPTCPPPSRAPTDIDFEAIAALAGPDPGDLHGLTEEDYDKLCQIAPTVARARRLRRLRHRPGRR